MFKFKKKIGETPRQITETNTFMRQKTSDQKTYSNLWTTLPADVISREPIRLNREKVPPRADQQQGDRVKQCAF